LKPTFKEIIPPLNPYQFNYQEYLVKQGIEHQVFVEHHQVKALGATNSSLKGIASRFRNYIITSLKKFSFNKDELGVINALLLGQRQDISKELITEYSRAGAIHILAVSGLHVGVIMFVLSFLLKPIERFKKGRFLKACLIVLFLWIFAFIAGLSASVVRAVTMFTFLTIGNIFSAKTNVKFSIITSMLFLLLIKPMFLFDVGFQLSYLAVFGIIWIQPKLYAIWSPKLKFIDKLWQLITVSIAAQAGILPLSIYYFNQFPSLFILSNLVIIPFLGLILFGGILVILLSVLDILPQFVAKMYGNIIHLMNQFVGWISQQESFLIKDISMSFLIMILFYVLLVCGVLFLIRKTTRRLIYFLMSIVVLQGIYMYEKIQKSNKKEFVVFHKSRKSLLGNRVGDTLQLLHNLDSIEFSKSTTTIPYVINENIEQVIESESQNIFQVFNHKILVIDSLGVYQIEGVNHPIIILQSSPKINLTRLIHQLKPKQIIADGSNYKSYINRWEVICEKEKIPFHYTGQKGAFVLKK
ncbi:MAG: ComEC/Rec2 family competence protein, partial [Flavobacteriaceae bacterium]